MPHFTFSNQHKTAEALHQQVLACQVVLVSLLVADDPHFQFHVAAATRGRLLHKSITADCGDAYKNDDDDDNTGHTACIELWRNLFTYFVIYRY